MLLGAAIGQGTLRGNSERQVGINQITTQCLLATWLGSVWSMSKSRYSWYIEGIKQEMDRVEVWETSPLCLSDWDCGTRKFVHRTLLR